MKKLQDKVTVILGGNSGIGLEAAKLFALEGAKVAIAGRNEQALDNALLAIGHESISQRVDVTDVETIESFYKTVTTKWGKIDVLAVNAGVFKGAPLGDFTPALFDEIISINFKGAFFSVQKALPYLKDGASIVLTSSTVAETAMADASAYSATKAAIRSLARSFSLELLDRKIRVNVLSPGPIDTEMISSKLEASNEAVAAVREGLTNLTPIKRLGTAQEIAKGFLFLASDDSSYMLGSELLMDGGVRTL
jgi:NAD(P)-dependent dehydrogenase (short-subunit alcohol dehydrogenase family)